MSNNNSRHCKFSCLGWRVFAYYFCEVIITLTLFTHTHNIHSWMHGILISIMQKTLFPHSLELEFSTLYHNDLQGYKIDTTNQRLKVWDSRKPLERTQPAPEHGSCWIICNLYSWSHYQTFFDASSCSLCLHKHSLTSLSVYYKSRALASMKEPLLTPALILWNV